MKKWEKVSVGDIASFQNGYAFKAKDFKENGKFPVIKIKELKDGLVRFFSDTAKIDVNNENEYSKYMVNEGDILFAMTGDPVSKPNPLSWVGRISLYTHKNVSLLNQRVCKAMFNDNIYPLYFYYYFRQDSVFYELAAKATGSASQANISTNTILGMPILLPDYETQMRIARILKSLDDKIFINNKINENLQNQAQAIFKSWFVDFEPFGGVMPNDWRISTLGEVSEMGAGGDKPKNATSTVTSENTIPIYSNGIANEGLYGFTDKAKIQDESVTVSARGTIGYVCLRQVPYVPIVRLVTLVPHKNIISAKYLYHWLKTLHIAGTGTTQQQLAVPSFKKTEIIVPKYSIMERFTITVAPLYEQILANKIENQRLSALRDTLLPKLMNGDVDVSQVKI